MFTESGNFVPPAQQDHFFQLGDEKCMFNVGSVGQPRDEDARACFAVLDTEENSVQYYRQEYDVSVTRDKIYAIPELDNMLGDRLVSGR